MYDYSKINGNYNFSPTTSSYNGYHLGLINGSFLQINVTKELNIGLDASIGLNLVSFENSKSTYLNNNIESSIQDHFDYTILNFSFNIGYQF